MRLDVSTDLAFPREQVFKTYRDKLVELVPYLPNIRGIAVVTRADDGPKSKMLNRWKGGGDIPALVRKFLSEDLLEWDDHADWDESNFTCAWRTIVPAFKDAVDSSGINHFEDLGNGRTRLTISGDLKVDASKVKGVPRLLAGTVSPAIESFLIGAIKPNLAATSKGVEKFLQAAK
jgi:hypothetical protein